MDPEQTFLRVHARLSGMLAQFLTPQIRRSIEFFSLAAAMALFALLTIMHVNFVAQPGCSIELSGGHIAEAQLVHIKITGGRLMHITMPERYDNSRDAHAFLPENLQHHEGKAEGSTLWAVKRYFNWLDSFVRRKKLMGHAGKTIGESKDLYSKGWRSFLESPRKFSTISFRNLNLAFVRWVVKKSKAYEPSYLYTVEKGYFMLSEDAKLKHNVRTVNISISTQHACFGNRIQQLIINKLVGYDTILMNSLLSARGQETKNVLLFPRTGLICLRGYLYNFQTKELYDLNLPQESEGEIWRFADYSVAKSGILIMSLFVFFTTTMSVSFTLRETQSRMLKFTVQLQHHARHHLPTFQLIFVHVIESLVFVPIMIGILFFLFEFYDDQLLAFMVLTLVWLCELFTMISVRTRMSMQFFPRFFMLYFLAFHIYFFSYAYGFSYLAFASAAAFIDHLILYFWNRFEVPALQRYLQSRGQLPPRIPINSPVMLASAYLARHGSGPTGLVAGFGVHPAREIHHHHPHLHPYPHPQQSNITTTSSSTAIGFRLGGSRSRDEISHNNMDIPVFNSLSGGNSSSVGRTERHAAEREFEANATEQNETVTSMSMYTSTSTSTSREAEFVAEAEAEAEADGGGGGGGGGGIANQSLSLSSLLLWILGGGHQDGPAMFAMFRDSRGEHRHRHRDRDRLAAAAAAAAPQQNEGLGRRPWWTRFNGGLTRIRRRHIRIHQT